MANAPNAERLMHIQTEAAKKLLSSLQEQGADGDADIIASAIEGETDLQEAIEAALSEIDEGEILIVGLEEKIKAFDARRKAQKDRVERIRALIEQALLATDQVSLRLPSATLSLTKRAASVVITNEADIPAKFWIPQERPAPKLDKKALAEALKAKEKVPGATLDNGTFSLSVRRR